MALLLYRNFKLGGAVDISNSPDICIEDTLFINDKSLGISNQPFSGNAGGVAIGYNNTGHLHDVLLEVTITRCSFVDNSALAGEDQRLTVLEVLSRRVYNQRGGGVAFYFGEDDYNGTVRIEHSNFTGNVADDSGGGIYMFLGGTGSNYTIDIYNTSFTGNRALDGGGLEITHSNPDSLYRPNSISVVECRFERNHGNFGGGYKNIQLNDLTNLNHLFIQNTSFDENEAPVGAGIYLQSVVTVRNVTLLKRITMENW